MSTATLIVTIASYSSAGLLAVTKLISACKPFWDKFPRWLAVLMPVLVLDLPLVATWIASSRSVPEILTAVGSSVGLLLPGIAEAEAKK